MVRIQVFLDDAMHALLRALASQQGRSVSALVREALARAFSTGGAEEQMRNWKAIEGLWRDRTDMGALNTVSCRRHLWTLDRRDYPMEDVPFFEPRPTC